MDKRTNKEIDDIAAAANLTPDQKTKLQQGAKDAEDKTLAEVLVKMRGELRKAFDQMPAQFAAQLEQSLAAFDTMWTGDMAAASMGMMMQGCTPPLEQDAWKTALACTLDPAQTEAWNKVLADRKEHTGSRIGEFLKQQGAKERERNLASLRAQIENMTHALNLSPERVAKLDALAQDCVEKSADAAVKKMESLLLEMDPAQREMMMKQNVNLADGTESARPDQQPAWVNGLAALLTEGERATLKDGEQVHKGLRARALTSILLTLLDEKTALTAVQRERLQPLAERIIREDATLFSVERESNYNTTLNPPVFYRAAAKMPAADVKAILTPEQWRRWRDIGENPTTGSDEEETDPPEKPKASPSPTPTPSNEPEEVERAVSDFLDNLAAKERKRLLGVMTLQADDASRVAALDATASARLQTAARGAAEALLQSWKTETESMIRSRVGDVQPQNVRQKLAGIEPYYFQSRANNSPEHEAVWTKTLATALNPAQHAAWQKELDLRQTFRDEAIAGIVTADFDRITTLTNEQWKQIEPKVAAAVKEYSPDFASVYSFSNDAPWYLGYVICLPMVGIPEKDLKAILTKKQWGDWAGSNEFSNVSGDWQGITANHDQRVKQAKHK